MINMFKKFIINKYFAIWILFFGLLLYFIFNPILSYKVPYMEEALISDYNYLYYIFLLPMTFYDRGFITSLLLEIMYMSIISYINVNYINYFFKTIASTTIGRIKRNNWIRQIFKINLIYSLLIGICYVMFYYGLCIYNDIELTGIITLLRPISYKLLITVMIPTLYTFCYVKTDSEIISLLFSFIVEIFLQLTIRMTLTEKPIIFNGFELVMVVLIILNLLLWKVTIDSFEGRDIS